MLAEVNQTLKRENFSLRKWNYATTTQNSEMAGQPRLLLFVDDDHTVDLLITLLMGYFDVHCISQGVSTHKTDVLSLRLNNVVEKQWQNNIKRQVEDSTPAKKIVLSSPDEKFLKEAAQVVNENLDNTNLNVATLSKEMALSPNKTYRKIKALTGLTAKEFIRMQRLKTAKDLLEQNKRSISEILYMVGFSSPSYFSRCFRSAYGCTPSEYVKKQYL